LSVVSRQSSVGRQPEAAKRRSRYCAIAWLRYCATRCARRHRDIETSRLRVYGSTSQQAT